MQTTALEICANSAAGCREAAKGGASRVELCAGLPEGGTTPSAGEISAARRLLKIPLHVIIRPRAGDFVYDSEELEIMCCDIETARRLGADGVVFGCLRPDGSYDADANALLMGVAKGLQTTFHRAVDVCADPLGTLEKIIAEGFNLVLTSGAEASALDGADLIARMVRRANGRIGVMAGCGVRTDNIAEIVTRTGVTDIHASLRSSIPGPMTFRNPRVHMGGTVSISEYDRSLTDATLVARAVKILRGAKA